MLFLSVRGGGRGLLVPREDNHRRIGCGPSGGGRGVCGTVLLKHVYILVSSCCSCPFLEGGGSFLFPGEDNHRMIGCGPSGGGGGGSVVPCF